MNFSAALTIILLGASGCKRTEQRVQGNPEMHCELHKRPLKSVSGYLPDPALLVDPGYGVTEFNAQFKVRYPHIRPWRFSPNQGDGWNVTTTVEVCEECEKNYNLDFAAYLKTDEKKRWNQYMDFLMKKWRGDQGSINPDFKGGVSDTKASQDKPELDAPVLPDLPPR